ncbi:DNA cytosine methyltransferase [Massilia sp. B-10]|nr:DNA cytosine methyltransferase [Massilia sp. B-10]UUZ57254.1 DNA cytosine methyltransferase [Massilia sp. H-1]
MAARIQGFPDYWDFSGTKTHAYRQVGNAFPRLLQKQLALRLPRQSGNMNWRQLSPRRPRPK